LDALSDFHRIGGATRPGERMKFDRLMDVAKMEVLPKRLRTMRQDALHALVLGLDSVLPEVLLPDRIILDRDALTIGGIRLVRESFSQVVIVGGGKATAGMCRSVIDVLGGQVPFSGAINVPYGQPVADWIRGVNPDAGVEVTFCSHPIPDEAGLGGVEKMLGRIAAAPQDALVLALISGGGSALMPLPAEGISLADKQATNRILLACGAAIDEINCIRKHLSRFKGGQLSVAAYPRRIFSLILSDVVGDDLQTIASGPTVPDTTTFHDAVEIVLKYAIDRLLPPSVLRRLNDGAAGRVPETPKPGLPAFTRTTNLIIGSAGSAAEVARQDLTRRGYQTEIFAADLHGEARAYGAELARRLADFWKGGGPAAFIATGEFTVTLRGSGKGGRNQEMLLGFLDELQRHPGLEANRLSWVVLSAAFDGIEGNSGAMGAIIDSSSLQRMQGLGINLRSHLERNDARAVFQSLGDLLVTGQTGTNVNDMTLILIDG